jgi:uncharacterized damage-inducible protein DinB
MNEPEFWMRGPVEGVPALLQPTAHALLQMDAEFSDCLDNFNDKLLWEKPLGVASVGFHALHVVGVIDRMFTYGEEKMLSEEQFEYLREESLGHSHLGTQELKDRLNTAIIIAIEKLKTINISQLIEIRYLGRKRVPVTLIGLLFHSAEHSMRHLGQALVTAQMLTKIQN